MAAEKRPTYFGQMLLEYFASLEGEESINIQDVIDASE
jgi:hypothetical protein